MRLASYEDFYGKIYTAYRHHEGYAKRAKLFAGFPERILIVGCGFGFLVDELERLGKQTIGVDASEWVVTNRISDHVLLGSILELSDMVILRNELGPFGTVITEDLLPYLTDDEARIASASCAQVGPLVVHMVTEQGEADLNYHSTGYWMALTGQLTVSLEGM